MAIAIVLILITVGSIVFHFLSPWWITPLASNWSSLDDTLLITFVVTGIVFVAINLFMAYAVIRFRYNEGRRADYEPENKKLEWWLAVLTSIGIVIMLAPGLFVYADFLHVPENTAVVEVVGQQWRWSYRFPGDDGVLGNVEPRRISSDNPFGMDPGDPNGQDDILIDSRELHLPVDKPIQMLLRSKDVVHDFYVPHFRVKMDAVPGVISGFWFTPTKVGQFDVACAEYCGMGHHTMRGRVVVDDEPTFLTWLNSQPTFSQTTHPGADDAEDHAGARGGEIAEQQGCLGCHSVDGSASVGPTWKGLFGKTETLADGSRVLVDEKYLEESIVDPNSAVVEGYSPIMPAYDLSAEDIDALIAFTKSIQK